jgi:hypothetical protein
MSRSEIDEHAAFTNVQRLRKLLDAAEDPDTGEDLLLFERVRKVARRLEALYSTTDPDFLSLAELDAANTDLLGAIAQVEKYSSGDAYEADTLTDLDTYVQRAVGASAPMLLAAPLVAPEQQREAAVNLRRSVGQLIRALTDEEQGVRAQLTEIQTAAVAQSEESARNLAALKANLGALEQSLATTLSRLQTTFLEGEATRSETATQAVAAAKLAAEEQAEEARQHAADLIGELQQRLTEARRLVNAVGQNAFAGGHGNYANEERWAANVWRYVAVGAALVIGGFGVIYLWTVGSTEFTWQGLWVRAVVLLPLAFLTAYAASESSKHRANEVDARNTALKLLAIDPYLELMDEDKKDAEKLRLAPFFFEGHPSGSAEPPKGTSSQLIELVGKAIDKIPGR